MRAEIPPKKVIRPGAHSLHLRLNHDVYLRLYQMAQQERRTMCNLGVLLLDDGLKRLQAQYQHQIQTGKEQHSNAAR